ncbi:MAG: RNA pseudouridine synthase [Clostridia bacterium]|nr:RNA pseudouridine synthase [Clostridia bacterium]
MGCPRDFLFRPVNRLDKGTSGLMAAAKNAHAQQLLQRLLHTDAFVREYLAICQGDLPERSGVIDLPIGKAGEGVRRSVRPDGSRAVTHYQVTFRSSGTRRVGHFCVEMYKKGGAPDSPSAGGSFFGLSIPEGGFLDLTCAAIACKI